MDRGPWFGEKCFLLFPIHGFHLLSRILFIHTFGSAGQWFLKGTARKETGPPSTNLVLFWGRAVGQAGFHRIWAGAEQADRQGVWLGAWPARGACQPGFQRSSAGWHSQLGLQPVPAALVAGAGCSQILRVSGAYVRLAQSQLGPVGEAPRGCCSWEVQRHSLGAPKEKPELLQVKLRSIRGLPEVACASHHRQPRPRILPRHRRSRARGRVGTTAGEARTEHRGWTPAPGVWAGTVSSSWLSLDLPGAKVWRAAKKFGNFFSGDLGELSRDYRIRRGQVRAVGWPGGVRGSDRPETSVLATMLSQAIQR